MYEEHQKQAEGGFLETEEDNDNDGGIRFLMEDGDCIVPAIFVTYQNDRRTDVGFSTGREEESSSSSDRKARRKVGDHRRLASRLSKL
jgi:hypothetical protein